MESSGNQNNIEGECKFEKIPNEVIRDKILLFLNGMEIWDIVRNVNKTLKELIEKTENKMLEKRTRPYRVREIILRKGWCLEDFVLVSGDPVHSGSFFHHCLCRNKKIEELKDDIFDVKIFTRKNGEERKDMIKRDMIEIPPHPSILQRIDSKLDEITELKTLEKFANLSRSDEEYTEKVRIGISLHWYGNEALFRKRFHLDEGREVLKKIKEERSFRQIDLVRTITSLLKIVCHLLRNGIASNFIFLKTLIIEENFKDVLIGGLFGAVHNLDRNGRIKPDDEQFKRYQGSEKEFVPMGWGYHAYLPPAVVDFDENLKVEDIEYLDFSKMDVFSVGMCAYNLVVFMWDDNINEIDEIWPFGQNEIMKPVTFDRKQENYLELGDYEQLDLSKYFKDDEMEESDVSKEIEVEVEKTYSGHTDLCYSIIHYPKIKKFVSCSFDGTIRLWNFNQEKSEKIIHKDEECTFQLFPMTEEEFVAVLEKGKVYALNTKKLIRWIHKAETEIFRVIKLTSEYLLVVPNKGELYVISYSRKKYMKKLTEESCFSLTFPIISNNYENSFYLNLSRDDGGKIKLIDFERNELVKVFSNHQFDIFTMAVYKNVRNEEMLVCAGRQNCIFIYDTIAVMIVKKIDFYDQIRKVFVFNNAKYLGVGDYYTGMFSFYDIKEEFRKICCETIHDDGITDFEIIELKEYPNPLLRMVTCSFDNNLKLVSIRDLPLIIDTQETDLKERIQFLRNEWGEFWDPVLSSNFLLRISMYDKSIRKIFKSFLP